MLVRCGVEDGKWTVLCEDLVDSGGITGIRNHRNDLTVDVRARKLLGDVEYRVLAVPQRNQSCGAERGELATQLTSDRAACTCNQNGLVLRQPFHMRQIRLDDVTPQ